MPYELLSKSTAITYHIGVPLFVMYFSQIFTKTSKRVVKLSQIAAGSCTLICLFTRSCVYDLLAIPSQLITIAIIAYLVYILFLELRQKNEDALIVVIGAIALFGATIIDILGYNYMQIASLLPYGLVVFIVSQSYLIASRFSRAYFRAEVLAYENDKMYHEIKDLNQGLEKKVQERTQSIKNLFDNAGQGFLSFGNNMRVDKEYSKECRNIFNKDIENMDFASIIYPYSQNDREFLIDLLQKIFSQDEEKRDVYISLLPDDVYINNRYVHIEYKLINNFKDKKLMVVLTDITDKKELQSEMEKERNILRMVVMSVAQHTSFVDSISEYKGFCETEIYELLGSFKDLNDIIYEIFRRVHTFKGIFSQFEMVNLVDKLHSLESELALIIRDNSIETLKQLKEYIESLNLIGYLDCDMKLLCEILGDEYFEKGKLCTVDEAELRKLEKEIACAKDFSSKDEIVKKIKKLWYRSLEEVLGMHFGYTVKLSDRLGKPINEIHYIGDEIYLDMDRYGEFIKSLVHVFRNCIEHGIETMDERLENGKDIKGSIKCSGHLENNTIRLEISDDGKGIDIEKIEKKAKSIRMLDKSCENIDSVDILNIIFEDGFSTNEQISEYSGRGVGLCAVKSILVKLGGRVLVETEKNKGTSFVFYIPIE